MLWKQVKGFEQVQIMMATSEHLQPCGSCGVFPDVSGQWWSGVVPLGGTTAMVGHYWFALMFQLDQNAAVLVWSSRSGGAFFKNNSTTQPYVFQWSCFLKEPTLPHSTPHHLVQLFLVDQGFTHPLTGFHSRRSQVKAACYLVGEKTRLESSRRRTGFPPSGLHHLCLDIYCNKS